MKKVLLIGLLLLLGGCGDRVTDADDNTDKLLLGLWDSVSNNSTVCHERLRLNTDKTFWWYEGNGTTTLGTYGRDDSRLNFMFTNKTWEVIKFQVTDRELLLTRTGSSQVYTRVPLAAMSLSACPSETKVRQ